MHKLVLTVSTIHEMKFQDMNQWFVIWGYEAGSQANWWGRSANCLLRISAQPCWVLSAIYQQCLSLGIWKGLLAGPLTLLLDWLGKSTMKYSSVWKFEDLQRSQNKPLINVKNLLNLVRIYCGFNYDHKIPRRLWDKGFFFFFSSQLIFWK